MLMSGASLANISFFTLWSYSGPYGLYALFIVSLLPLLPSSSSWWAMINLSFAHPQSSSSVKTLIFIHLACLLWAWAWMIAEHRTMLDCFKFTSTNFKWILCSTWQSYIIYLIFLLSETNFMLLPVPQTPTPILTFPAPLIPSFMFHWGNRNSKIAHLLQQIYISICVCAHHPRLPFCYSVGTVKKPCPSTPSSLETNPIFCL